MKKGSGLLLRSLGKRRKRVRLIRRRSRGLGRWHRQGGSWWCGYVYRPPAKVVNEGDTWRFFEQGTGREIGYVKWVKE